MKTADALRLIIVAIRDTNKDYVMCQPTVPMWTGTFADKLEKHLNEKFTTPSGWEHK